MSINTIDTTIDFIKLAHNNVFDKTGFPYWEHPYRVMQYLGEAATDDEKHAALLHDVGEDTEYSLSKLIDLGYTDGVIEIVKLVTIDKDKNMPYIHHIAKIANSGNKSAIKVKVADIMDNTDPDRLILLDDSERLLLKYRRALRVLLLSLLNYY